ncbi:hypothetical protein ILUMI_16479 [Ignelater luminosus]|uniref:Partial AB-hydrolase lipase domain-containing protein n=1 Tax=Ignelater luminosus TaxID=2038154 RepID=A0A8K0G866_IGNLU|nr:hypothetical protein ILUMI_16479 [Ignelater luminosus]
MDDYTKLNVSLDIEDNSHKPTRQVPDDNEISNTSRGLIEKNGYPFENHTVQTEDGYILEIHRIPHGRNSSRNTGPPVLFVPGYFCSSADWVNMGPENSLGFILADKGYDVWLANYRGTRYIHTALTQNYELLGYNSNTAKLAAIFCQDGAITQGLCVTLYYLAGGYSPSQINKTRLPVILTNIPAGSSIRQGQHFAQLITTAKFQKYDYGRIKNLKIYGQPAPPQYDLSKITAPLAIYVEDRDIYAKKKDTDKTAAEVSNLVVYRYIKGFSHADVIWGIDAPSVVFNDILEQMRQY